MSDSPESIPPQSRPFYDHHVEEIKHLKALLERTWGVVAKQWEVIDEQTDILNQQKEDLRLLLFTVDALIELLP